MPAIQPHRSLLLLAALLVFPLVSAETTTPDLTTIRDPAVWRLCNRSAQLLAESGKQAVRLDLRAGEGVAWLVDSNFTEGLIELDLRGANNPGKSFLGLAFRGADDTSYDAVYFRPFNFKNPEIPRRARAVQYISMPQFPWKTLRADFPGRYEAEVSPVPDPDGWFHARIVVENRRISVYVNDARAPALVCTELSARRGGQLGLWVGDGSDGAFANLKITPRNP